MISLRMFTEAELIYFDSPPAAEDDPFSFYGFQGRSLRIRARYAQDQLVSELNGMLAIDLDGAVVGDVQWRVQSYGPPPMSNALNIGIRLLPDYRGRGYGTTAQAALAQYLFATYPVNRIEAGT